MTAPAIRLTPRVGIVMALSAFLGLVAFFWSFVVVPGTFGSNYAALLIFGVLLVLVLCVVLFGTVFFVLGCTSLFASVLITGGVGPWMPYQMFGCAFVGMLARFLPRTRCRYEVLMLAGYGSVAGYLFGFLLNLSFWPFSLDPNSSIAYLPGLPFTEQWHRYLDFDLATSLGRDTGRAITNFVCILLADPAVLTTFRRAAREARFRAPVRFATPVRVPDWDDCRADPIVRS
ncbi:ECF transporter S component [Streptomyces sp. NPDC050528]|uniref:ECF transporter S component n=1 Tax=unclassified Streptomyces TaxID=2593676 RepID=UPI00379E7E98